MSFEWRVLAAGLATFAVTGLVAALIVPALASRRSAASAAVRSRRLARIRLVPAAVATAASLAVTAAFLVFEPRRVDEQLGWSVQVAAACGGAVLLAAAWRTLRIVIATRRLRREWFSGAEPIAAAGCRMPAVAVTSAFPVVAVIGIGRPTLVVARSVLTACSPDELRAVLAHEQGHLDRRDNLRRLMLMAAPDVLAWLPISKRLYAAWCDTSEEAADDDAARCGQDGRLHLASALVKVARLATGRHAGALAPTSAFYCGQNIERRVRRLLDPPVAAPAVRPGATWLRNAAAVAVVVTSVAALQGLHALIEVAIHALP